MALQGTIDSFPLDDVLGFLAGSAQRGLLRVEGDRGTVRLWIADGSIVGAESAGAAASDPVQVVFEALRFGAGSFSFDDDRSDPRERLEPQAIASVVHEAAALRDEWDAIEAVLPSPSHQLHAVVPLPHDHVTLDAASWRIVTALGRTDTVASVLARSGMTELDAARGLVTLVRQGLVEVGEPSASRSPSVVVDEVDVQTGPPTSRSNESRRASIAADVAPDDELVRLDLGELEGDAEPVRTGASGDVAPVTESAVTESAVTESAVPGSDDHFPIDDLVGVDTAVDPWTPQSPTERVAQPFIPVGEPAAQPAAFAPAADEDSVDTALEQATWMSQGAADAIAEVLGAPASAGGGRTYEGGDPAFR